MVICLSSLDPCTPPVTLDSRFTAMKYIWFAAVWLIILNLPRSQAVNCLNLKENCRMSGNECAGLWNLTEQMCDLSGVDCQLKSLTNCNVTISYITKQYPDFKACTCSEDIYCTIKKLLGRSCNSNSVPAIPAGPFKQKHSIIQKEFSQNPKMSLASGKTNDCISAKHLCSKDNDCLLLYEKFKSQCIHQHECIVNDAVQSCLTAWSELKKTVMGNCVCFNSTKRKCIKVWNSIYNNTCLQYATEKQISTYSEDKKDFTALDSYSSQGTISLEWENSSLKNIAFRGPKSCFDATKICVGDPVCNRHLTALMKACPVSGTTCNVKDCKRTIRAFYETMPFNIAQVLAFCDCDPSNETCHLAGDVYSKSCTAHTDVPISCLHVVSICLDNELCRDRYRLYQSKCWEPVSRCHNNRSCLLGLHKEDLTSSGDDKCRAAYIRTLGTKLQIPCTCSSGLNYEEQHLCGLFSHILQSKSCLKKNTTNNIHAPYSDSQGEQIKNHNPRTFQATTSYIAQCTYICYCYVQESQRINFWDNCTTVTTSVERTCSYAVVYIVAYTSGIILISGIILLTLLQTRACKSQKKPAVRRGNVSESLINS